MPTEPALRRQAQVQSPESGRLIGGQQPKPEVHIDMDGLHQKPVSLLRRHRLKGPWSNWGTPNGSIPTLQLKIACALASHDAASIRRGWSGQRSRQRFDPRFPAANRGPFPQ